MKMKSIDQYIDLFTRNREAFDKDSPEAMNRLRMAAYGSLRGKSLPEKGDEGYEKRSEEHTSELQSPQ